MSKDLLALLVGSLIPIIWTVAALGSYFTGDYTLIKIVTPLMIAEVGWLFGIGVGLLRRESNGKPG